MVSAVIYLVLSVSTPIHAQEPTPLSMVDTLSLPVESQPSTTDAVPLSLQDETLTQSTQMAIEEGILTPLNLNQVTIDELKDHPSIHAHEAKAIVNYRARYGLFQSVYELAYVSGITFRRAQELALIFHLGSPLTRAIDSATRTKPLHQWEISQRAWYRIPIGYTEEKKYRSEATRPVGSPLGLQTRITYQWSNIVRAGLKGQKAPTEPFFTHFNRYGYGFYSAYVEVNLPQSRVDRLVLGHYHYSVGYGLLLQTRSLLFSQYEPRLQGRLALRPRAGFNYSGGNTLTGTALSIRLPRSFRFTAAFSFRMPHSRLRNQAINTLHIAPPIATPSQATARYTTRETLAVVDCHYSGAHFIAGAALRTLHYSHPFLPKKDIPTPWPQHSHAATLYGGWYGSTVQLCGDVLSPFYTQEKPHWHFSGTCAVLGMNLFLHDWVSATVQLYAYGKGNRPTYQQNYSPRATPIERCGSKVLLQLSPRYLYAYYVQYQFFNDHLAQWHHILQPQYFDLRLGATYTSLPRTVYTNATYRLHTPTLPKILQKRVTQRYHVVHDFRLLWHYNALSGFLFRSYLLARYRALDTAYGIALYPEVGYRLSSCPLEFRLRAGFHTIHPMLGTFRLYESTPRYTFAMGSLSRTGSRVYLYARWQPWHALSVWLKVGKTFYSRAALASIPSSERASRRGIDAMLQLLWTPRH